MAVLHDELQRIIQELCTDAWVIGETVRHVAEQRGISLSDVQVEAIVQAARRGDDTVDVEGVTEDLEITAEDIESALPALEAKMEVRVERAITHALEHMAPSILSCLHAALPEALQERRETQAAFEKRLAGRWKDGLDRLEMLIIMAHEAGETFEKDAHREIAEDGEEEPGESVLLRVLVALHCRACRTAREVLRLLTGGYADGAHARWRSLHEIAVTAQFLVQHRGDVPQRYLDHAAVERWRAAEQYQTHCPLLGYEPFSAEEIVELEAEFDAAIAKYGAPFGRDYGWAASALASSDPSFAKIEANIDMSKWRPFFKSACQSVHAGSQGLFQSLGILEGEDPMLLAGASNAGLADPGHQAAISLSLASVALLTSRPNLDGLVTCKCMLLLCDDIGERFQTACETLERDAELHPSDQ